jgi:hypothetical protein
VLDGNVNHLCSRLGLCAGNQTSGGKALLERLTF